MKQDQPLFRYIKTYLLLLGALSLAACGGGSSSDDNSSSVDNTSLVENSAPTIMGSPLGSVVEDTTYTFTPLFDDDDNDSLTFTILNQPVWASFDDKTGSLTGKPSNEHVGIYNNVTIAVSDGKDTTSLLPFDISVLNSNDSPFVLNPVDENQVVQEGTSYILSLVGLFSDPDDGDVLILEAVTTGSAILPAWLSLNTSTQVLSGIPGNADVGVVNITLLVRDTSNETAEQSFSLAILNVNNAPTATPITSQTAIEDEVFSLVLNNVFFDEDAGDILTYRAEQKNGSALPVWLSFDLASKSFSGTPGDSDIALLDVVVFATDISGAGVSSEFALNVMNVNDKPTLVAGGISNQVVLEDDSLSLNVDNAFSDADIGDTLTFTAGLVGGSDLPAWLSFNDGTKTFTGIPSNTDVGTLSILVTAVDGDGESISDIFDLTVKNTNDAPTVLNPITDQQATQGIVFEFVLPSDTFTDVDTADVLTYSVGALFPGWLSFDAGTQTFLGTPTNDNVGELSIDVKVNDVAGETIIDTFILVVVNMNDAPTISGVPSTVAEPTMQYSFVPLAEDVDLAVDSAEVLSFAISGLPAWAMFDTFTGELSGVPTEADEGVEFNGIKISAVDRLGEVAKLSTFSILVSAQNMLFEDNFNDGESDGWVFVDDNGTFKSSDWGVEFPKGVLKQSGDIRGYSVDGIELGTHALLDSYTHGASYDFRAKVNSKYTSSAKSAFSIGVLFGYQDADNYYRFDISKREGHRMLLKREAGVFTELATSPQSYAPGINVDVRIVVDNGVIIVFMDGEQVLAAADVTPPASGKFAFMCARSESCQFDDMRVLELPDSPVVGIVEPSEYFVSTGGTIRATAVFTNPGSVVNGVRFSINGSALPPQDVKISPFSVDFMFPAMGEYDIKAQLLDITDGVINTSTGATDISEKVGVLGFSLVTIGDSVTGGEADDIWIDDISCDERNTSEGFQPILNTKLSGMNEGDCSGGNGIPVTVVDEGNSGENSAEGATRIVATVARTQGANVYMVSYGANDSRPSNFIESGLGLISTDPGYSGTFKDNIQTIIEAIRGNGKVFLAKALPILGDADRSASIEQTNRVIDELLIENTGGGFVFSGPDFYTYFNANTDQMSADGIHPSGVGYQNMSRLWFDSLDGNL